MAATGSLLPLAGFRGELVLSALDPDTPHTESSCTPYFLLDSVLSGSVLGVCFWVLPF